MDTSRVPGRIESQRGRATSGVSDAVVAGRRIPRAGDDHGVGGRQRFGTGGGHDGEAGGRRDRVGRRGRTSPRRRAGRRRRRRPRRTSSAAIAASKPDDGREEQDGDAVRPARRQWHVFDDMLAFMPLVVAVRTHDAR